jgi:predicted aspartyl protease
MSRFAFNPSTGPIHVAAEVTGPAGSLILKFILDTGATASLIDISTLISLGFDPDQSGRTVTVLTGSSVEVVPLVVLTRLSAMGQHRIGFPVLAHALPTGSAVDGLLGLDFFRNLLLTIDFRAGQISLA